MKTAKYLINCLKIYILIIFVRINAVIGVDESLEKKVEKLVTHKHCFHDVSF